MLDLMDDGSLEERLCESPARSVWYVIAAETGDHDLAQSLVGCDIGCLIVVDPLGVCEQLQILQNLINNCNLM